MDLVRPAVEDAPKPMDAPAPINTSTRFLLITNAPPHAGLSVEIGERSLMLSSVSCHGSYSACFRFRNPAPMEGPFSVTNYASPDRAKDCCAGGSILPACSLRSSPDSTSDPGLDQSGDEPSPGQERRSPNGRVDCFSSLLARSWSCKDLDWHRPYRS